MLLSELPAHIGRREIEVLRQETGWDASSFALDVVRSAGPGNVILLEIESAQVTELFTGFGVHGVRAESVTAAAVQEMRAYLAAGVPVGEHLADQLLLPLALAGRGGFTTSALDRHATTQIDLIQRFLALPIEVVSLSRGRRQVRLGPPA